MSAIQTFFNDERARTQRIRARRVHHDVPDVVELVDQAKLDTAYATLKNWIVYSPEDLLYYCDTLDQDEYQYILDKKNDFPLDVQTVLWGLPPCEPIGSMLSVRWTDLTNARYTNMLAVKQAQVNERVNAQLKESTIPPRPHSDIDDKLCSLRAELAAKEAQLQQLMTGPTKKYVVPSIRTQTVLADPAVQAMKAVLSATKNEISCYEKYVANADNGWADCKQFELRRAIIEEMYAV